MPYYKRIRELREDHDFSQRKVAEILKMKQPQYFRYEQGFRDIPTDILISLSDLYDVSIDYCWAELTIRSYYGKMVYVKFLTSKLKDDSMYGYQK